MMMTMNRALAGASAAGGGVERPPRRAKRRMEQHDREQAENREQRAATICKMRVHASHKFSFIIRQKQICSSTPEFCMVCPPKR